MKRTPEPELMNTPEQAAAYAGNDLDNAYWLFMQCFRKYFAGLEPNEAILDLGCGPAAIALRLARLFPNCEIHGVDGAPHMLARAQAAVQQAGLKKQIHLYQGILPEKLPLPQNAYPVVISNSFLHHLADPMVLWNAIDAYGRPGAAILIIDLVRPQTESEARRWVDRYLPEAPAILREDMLLSLHAAFTLDEIAAQLREAQLADSLSLTMATPFQCAVYGYLKSCT